MKLGLSAASLLGVFDTRRSYNRLTWTQLALQAICTKLGLTVASLPRLLSLRLYGTRPKLGLIPKVKLA